MADARERALLEPSDEAILAGVTAYYMKPQGINGDRMRRAIIAANTSILQAKTEATE
jgi:hypothetical protein